MRIDEIRRQYLSFFESKGHKLLPSASLIPSDPTTLLTTAGMQPFVPWFKREVEPEYPRVTTCQKCLRQDDLENVGVTARHLSFFEMLGNFSFGDYFKQEAIEWAWEFITQGFGIAPERLWISVHTTDDEAADIWHKRVGVPQERIVRLEDSWWGLGMPNTPCGPCTELYVDMGPEYGQGEPGGDNDRYFEIWNIVFQMYNDDGAGGRTLLPRPGIDTGMGLERAGILLQGVHNPFELDVFKPLITRLASLAEVEELYGNEETSTATRVIAEHARASTFLISDGVMPSNEGRGYLLRRLIRRAYRFGRALGLQEPFLHKLAPAVVEGMKGGYPELVSAEETITEVIAREEARFQETLDDGLALLNKALDAMKAKGETTLSGAEAFKLYDSNGFPLDLTRELAAEAGFKVDEEGFKAEMEAQRTRSRFAGHEDLDLQARYETLARELGKTEFVGYEETCAEAKVVALFAGAERVERLSEGQEGEVVLDTTPFYAESGGQVGDTGTLTGAQTRLKVTDTQKRAGELIFHVVKVETGTLAEGDAIVATVDRERRKAIERNHTATHLLHAALRQVLGEHARQAGAYKDERRLRFDFSHFQQVTREELAQIERLANQAVLANTPVTKEVTDRQEAEQRGAMALFGEKYGAKVRVVEVPGFSLELCGGCHVASTGDIGLIKIVSETGIGSNLRRIEATTGLNSLQLFEQRDEALHEVAGRLGVPIENASQAVERLFELVKAKDKEIRKLKQQALGAGSVDPMAEVQEIAGVKVLAWRAEGADAESLRSLSDQLINRIGEGVLLLAGVPEPGKVVLIARVTSGLTGKLKAGEIAKRAAQACGGGGGGRPDFAQAGGKNEGKLNEAFEAARAYIAAALEG